MSAVSILIHFDCDEDKKEFNLINCKAKISNFKFSICYDENTKPKDIVSYPLYMDPILLLGLVQKDKGEQEKAYEYNEKVDIWSLGIIMCKIVLGSNQELKCNNGRK